MIASLPFRTACIAICFAMASLLASCAGPKQASVEDLGTHQVLSYFKLGSIRGTRDGDRLKAQAVFTDSSSVLTIDMQFEISPVCSLQSGTWRWSRTGQMQNGEVAQRSVEFLGGQSDGPSIGGTYDLLANGVPKYRVTIPLTVLKTRM